jgi:protein TonB
MSKPSELHPPSSDGHSQPNMFDTQELRTLSSDGAAQTELLVLSRDESLIEVVRKAAPSVVRVISAPDVDEVADRPGLNPGVLVVDASITNDVHAMLPQLRQHFPEIVIVVVGTREDVSALMRLTASGGIFRFLLIPLAHGQTRLALGAAVAHHLEIKAANVRTGAIPIATVKKFSLAYPALGLGLIVAIAGIWWGIGALTGSEPTPVASQPVATAPSSLPIASQPSALQAQLQLAKDAFEQGNYTEPGGNSALDLYRKTLELDPENQEAQAGVRAVADKILGKAERALTAAKLPEAVQGIEIARGIDAANPRLEFLDVQVARERERLKLDQERDRAHRVRQLVQQASGHITAQRFLRPAGSNARDALLEARKLDPSDPAVVLAIGQLASTLTDAARKAAAAGDVAQTKELLEAARRLGAAEATLATVERSLSETPRAREAAASRPAPSPAPERTVTRAAVSEDKMLAAESAPKIAAVSNAVSPGANDSAPQSGSASAPPQPTSSAPDQWLQAIDLPRTRAVAPDYPTQAFINGTEGWVDVDFTITAEGVPENLRVRDSSPRRTFDRAALDSVRQWRFVPIRDNGAPVERRATLRVRFQRQ